jgi:hypothetical protein
MVDRIFDSLLRMKATLSFIKMLMERPSAGPYITNPLVIRVSICSPIRRRESSITGTGGNGLSTRYE